MIAAGTILRRSDLDRLDLSLLEEIPGEPGDLLMTGGSAIIAPNGQYLAGPLFDEPGIITAEIQPEMVIDGRLTLDVDGHYSRPDVFQLQVNETPQTNVTYVDRHPR